MSYHQAKPEHQVLYQDLIRLIDKHAGKLTSAEMIAVAANVLGKLIAYQSPRIMTPEMAMEIVIRNIEVGNQQVLEQLWMR